MIDRHRAIPSANSSSTDRSPVQGLPTNAAQRQVELQLGLGHCGNVERDPPLPAPQQPTFLYSNGMDKTLAGRITVGTPHNTPRIWQRARAYTQVSKVSRYEPEKNIEWVMHSTNVDGFDTFPSIPEPYLDKDGILTYDIRQTMIDVLCINYPNR